jgi:hypothetical protein
MKGPRAYRPTVQRLEDRVVLSLSFGSFLHSLFPLFSSGSKHPKKPHLAAVGHAAVGPHSEAVRARHAVVVVPHSAKHFGLSVVTKPTPGNVPVFGPYLGRPGSYHKKPPLVTRPVA